MQDRLKKNEKSQNQFQNGLRRTRKIQVKKGKRTDLSQTRKIQTIVKDIMQNKIKQIKKNTNLVQNIFTQVKTRKILFEKGMKKIAKMQNLLQNELNQIEEMCDKSQDELERIAKIRSKNYEEMSKEELIMSFLKSNKTAELFNNNLNDNDKISDIRRILNGSRYMYYPKNIESKLKKSFIK